MTTLLIHRACCIATQDDANTELNDASLLLKDGRIEHIISADENIDELLTQVDEVIDARRHVVVPGLINTHHHMVQSLTRAVPQVQNAELFSWLKGLYPIWAGLTPEMVRVSNQVAMAELLLSGCTTSSSRPSSSPLVWPSTSAPSPTSRASRFRRRAFWRERPPRPTRIRSPRPA